MIDIQLDKIRELCIRDASLDIEKRNLGVRDIIFVCGKNVVELDFKVFSELFPMSNEIGHDDNSLGVNYYYREEQQGMVFYATKYESYEDN